MTVVIRPGTAKGKVCVPASKSVAHRYLIAAALAVGESRLLGLTPSEDILATCDCLKALGVRIRFEGTTATVTGGTLLSPVGELPCRECGTTLRLLLPLCLISGAEATLTGTEKLLSRPLGVYEELCRERGFLFDKKPGRVTVAGCLVPGSYSVPGDISSQFISGMCFALACLADESTLTLTGPIESRSYIDLTLDALGAFGVDCRWVDDRTIRIPGGCAFRAGVHTVEGDESSAAFFEALSALGDPVETLGLDPASRQGDRVARTYFEKLCGEAVTLSVADCPDLAPILMTVAALSHGGTLTHTARLRLKESDRGAAMAQELSKCGVRVTLGDDSLTVDGGGATPPKEPLSGHNDHRIVMALAILLTRLGGEIRGAEAVAKSYPSFFDHLAGLGIETEILEKNA